jgi:GH15 family glucan-1,4-alpha-glucosidase
MGGYNPWPIATCWMALYNLEAGDEKEAIENFKFVINTVSDNGLLGEQVNNDIMKPCWIFGLTWSHAMFIIVLEELLNRKLL